MLRLHDTATGTLETIAPAGGGPVRLYVCGPTVYGPPHVGHGRQTLVYDVLRRYIESTGTTVHHVSNVTDIDDKIINRANEEGRPWQEIATECEEAWWSSMDKMGLAKPHETPHATGYVPEMVELIAELAGKGAAYELEDGVYLSVAEVPGYGLLAQQSLDSLRAGARVEVVAGKRTPMDFVLWKKVKPGEPSWPSPGGAGRPGWHTECVVMSLSLLGEGFELHGGGTDLKFPHHENERAQAVALGRPFAAHWMHHEMVEVRGEKMAKSVGNVTDLADILETFDPRAYRLLMLQAHYRAPMEVKPTQLEAAGQALERLDSLARRINEVVASHDVEVKVAAPGPQSGPGLTAAFRERMDDDLDTPRAMAVVFDAVRGANASLASGDVAAGLANGRAALECAAALGIRAATGRVVSDHALALATQRDEARAARDWAAADRIRDELVAMGYRVEDTSSGTRLYG
ncbi:MAG: cysteine--tRNA ligase [Acidimicrobiales bacterium]